MADVLAGASAARYNQAMVTITRSTRRQWLVGASATSLGAALAGCGAGRPVRAEHPPAGEPPPPPPAAHAPAPRDTAAPNEQHIPQFALRAEEQALISAGRDDFDIVQRGQPNAAVLRRRSRQVPLQLDLAAVAARMERTMTAAKGVGLAAPQVGLGLRAVTVMLDYKTDHPRTLFARNPMIVERSDETIEGYEMCLSIPGIGGLVRRSKWIRVVHTSLDGQTVTTEAEDHNSVLWQHEIDHLDGVLYLDRVLGELLPADEVRKIRRQQEGVAAPKRSSAPWPLPRSEATAFVPGDHPEGG
ncbi:MAG: peptide deformylase [Deltaproteobacteria bacterium]|jgi:peptide deformylase|nr:peptide deformylase [Deltaproteobacteria bacterium]MBW2531099.1 peptide deformylase [Deltaproteobacteria bacterium]